MTLDRVGPFTPPGVTWNHLLLLAVAHGIADGAAGWRLGQTLLHQPAATVALGVLLYNGVAFGGQPLVGLWIDRHQQPQGVTVLALGLLALGVELPHPLLALAGAGVGSALFHPSAGAIAARQATAGALGLFAAPGILGLTVGFGLGMTEKPFGGAIALGLLALAGALAWVEGGAFNSPAVIAPPPPIPAHSTPGPWQETVLVILVGAIALRSGLWLLVQTLHQGAMGALLSLGLAAAVGKVLGGYGGDRYGTRRWLWGALGGAALCLPWPILPLQWLGVAWLQSTVPLAWRAVMANLPRQPATATGLALGLAVALGGLWLLPGLLLPLLAPLPLFLGPCNLG
jgi:FSR family fosmidomycin resistance protein-like MFS transporter